MGQVKITDREWLNDHKFWFELDGPVIIKQTQTDVAQKGLHESKCWIIQYPKYVNNTHDSWVLQRSDESQTRDHNGSCLNVYPDSAKEVFCRFTAQIVRYKKPVTFAPHREELDTRLK